MAKDKVNRPKARLPRGFADRSAAEIRRTSAMLATIRSVYERWGFEPVETPFVEYADALGQVPARCGPAQRGCLRLPGR